MMTSTSISRYRTMADANASGMQPSSTAVNSPPVTVRPSRSGTRYRDTNGSAPSAEPQTIQRSCRRDVTDRSRRSARSITASPPSRHAAR